MKEGKKTRKKLHEIDLEQDIRYRGPLSYRGFKIMGWLCIAVSQLVMLLTFASRFMPADMAPTTVMMSILSSIGSLSVPFLLFSNFSRILSRRDSYKHQIMVNGFAALAVVLIYLFVFFHYIVGLADLFSISREDFMSLLQIAAAELLSGGMLTFNIFIDLFLCTMFMFFLNYEPKRVFTGKKLIIFRLFAIFPILYEAASIAIKINVAGKLIVLSPVAYPFLTTKPPIMFLVFIILVLYIKNRERRFCKGGRSKEEYRQFLGTNRNSLHFSVFTAILFLVAAIVDLVVLLIILISMSPSPEMLSDEAGLNAAITQILRIGVGKSTGLAFVAPIMLLYSYTRKHKNSIIDYVIPIGGIILVIFIYTEFVFQALRMLPGMFAQ